MKGGPGGQQFGVGSMFENDGAALRVQGTEAVKVVFVETEPVHQSLHIQQTGDSGGGAFLRASGRWSQRFADMPLQEGGLA